MPILGYFWYPEIAPQQRYTLSIFSGTDYIQAWPSVPTNQPYAEGDLFLVQAAGSKLPPN